MALEDIFRAYDIRGRVPDDLDPDVMERIGRAYGTDLQDRGHGTVVVGHDVRLSSPDLTDALVDGITSTGVDVHDAGHVPYGPILYAGWSDGMPGAYVTASHLTKEWNGVKFSDDHGCGYPQELNEAVHDRFDDGTFLSGDGDVSDTDVLAGYSDHLLDRVDLAGVDVLMDCGNGSAGVAAPDLFWGAGAQLEVVNGDPDGTFPNRHSDPDAESLRTMRTLMRDDGHDIGIAYDGDADRVAVVDGTGRLLDAEQVAAVVLPHILAAHDGPVVANVECSRLLEDVAHEYGREVVRVRVGHSYLFDAVHEHGAVMGVEKSRHMGFSHVLPVNDGIAASMVIASIVGGMDRELADAVDDLPSYVRDREAFEVPDSAKFDVIADMQDALSREYDDTNTLDGIRVDLDEGWILVRASNTSPKIRLTVEAETQDAFDRLHDEFSAMLRDAIDRHA